MGGSLLFRFLVEVLYGLKNLDLYAISQRMGTNPAMTTMTFHHCSGRDLEKTAIRDGFMLYNFHTSEFYRLEEDSILAAQRIRG